MYATSKNKVKVLVVLSLLTWLVVHPVAVLGQAQPPGTVDVSNLEATPSALYQGGLQQYLWWGQSFVAGRSGAMVAAQVMLFKFSTGTEPTDPFAVELREVDASGAPSMTVLASETVPASAVTAVGAGSGTLVTVSFDPPAPVVAGDRYALVLTTQSPASYAISFDTTDGYPDGQVWMQFDPLGRFGQPYPWTASGGFDMIFATYVEEPFTEFAALDSTVAIQQRVDGRPRAWATVEFTLGEDSNDIDPVAEGVTMMLGDAKVEIPPGAVHQVGPNVYRFASIVEGNLTVLTIRSTDETSYRAQLIADVDGVAAADTIDITVAIGDDRGTEHITVEPRGDLW